MPPPAQSVVRLCRRSFEKRGLRHPPSDVVGFFLFDVRDGSNDENGENDENDENVAFLIK